jgi:hypothetical protein
MITEARAAEHSILHKDPSAYCAHPQIVVAANGDWLVVFNRGPRRPLVLHPPEDPRFQNVIIRSRDRGRSWSAPRIVPSDAYSGTECAALTLLADGSIMLHQWQFTWHPLVRARELPDQSSLVSQRGARTARPLGSRAGQDLRPFLRRPWRQLHPQHRDRHGTL